MRNLIKLLEPDRFEDLMALRGPVPAGAAERRACTPSTPSASTAASRSRTRTPTSSRSCEHTYGVMVYQEQVMQIAVAMAGLLDGRGRHAPQGHGQEDPREASTPSARSSSTGCRRKRPRGAARRGDLRPDRALRRLRVQRLARLRVRLRRVPDRVPDGPPPGRVHVGDPHVGQGRQGPQALLPVRVPRHGHRGAAARRERVRDGLRARRRARSPRSATACRPSATWARARSQQILDARRAEGRVHVVRRLLPQGRARAC